MINGAGKFITLSILLQLAFAVSANAQQQTGTSEAKASETTTQAEQKAWGVKASIEASSNLLEDTDVDHSRGMGYTIVPSYSLNSDLTLNATIIFEHDLVHEDKSDFKNTDVSLAYKPIEILKEELNLTPKVFVALPTNYLDRKERSFQGGFGAAQTTAFALKRIGLPEVSLSYGLSLRKSVNEYDRDNVGTSNTSYTIANTFGVDATIKEKYSISVLGRTYSSRTYSEYWRSKFEFQQEIGYSFNDNAKVYVGHNNLGPTLKNDMNTSNVEVFNENTSAFYVGVGATY